MVKDRKMVRKTMVQLIKRALGIGAKTEAKTTEYHLLDKCAGMFETPPQEVHN